MLCGKKVKFVTFYLTKTTYKSFAQNVKHDKASICRSKGRLYWSAVCRYVSITALLKEIKYFNKGHSSPSHFSLVLRFRYIVRYSIFHTTWIRVETRRLFSFYSYQRFLFSLFPWNLRWGPGWNSWRLLGSNVSR